MRKMNEVYFEILRSKFASKVDDLQPMHCPENNVISNVIPYSIANRNDLHEINVVQYNYLSNDDSFLKNFSLNILKMQAGLGTSVKREDLLVKYTNRTSLGSKGTDLFFKVNDSFFSIAEIQLLQAYSLSNTKKFKEVVYRSLVNEETLEAVENCWNTAVTNSAETFLELYKRTPGLRRGEDIVQLKVPTLNESGEFTEEHMAPAGHGFIGFYELYKTFTEEIQDEITVIGNGEDLSSTPDEKILNWVVKENIPIVMITTTKTEADKKGGQISIVRNPEGPSYVTIIEKAQAEKFNQLDYFEQLGLREGDREGLFNTNIVIFNKRALKEVFQKYLSEFDSLKFTSLISPDVIENVKMINGKSHTQLESALGSVILNFDRYMRLNYNSKIVSFLNLEAENRSRFFMPIKNRENYDWQFKSFKINPQSFRFI